MSSARLQTIKEIFHAARELQPAERRAFLHRSCAADEQLQKDVEALLRSHEAANGFIAQSPAQLAAEVFGADESLIDAGRTIGRYRLIHRIGAGGMGAVYLAERADQQFEMQVAIKVIKRGMDTESVLRRFQHERQILASLEHPNIARLLDGGTTEDGLPYFVMEHVKGERIDRYAEAKNLSLHERLEIFRQICGAVSYAHQHLVVHRDLKPSNIVVTPDGVPKLLDFGIAKIMQANEGMENFATMTMAPLLTPEYASPEQFEGEHATTQSDVYSLGVVLYELLTGTKPYRTKTERPEEMARAVRDQEPTRPSENRASKIDHPKSLRGDLDNIVLMAMRKETARRYRSVEQFSEDIRRHLAGLPVIARRDTMSYRAAKFLQRNRIAVAAAALILLSLIAGVVATSWQAHKARLQEQRARAEQARAERRFNEVRKLANRALFDYHDAIKFLPGSTKARELLVRDALTYLDSLATESHGDRALQRELATAYERVGDIRGERGGASLGDIGGALESYTKALAIREAHLAAQPADAEVRRVLAHSHERIGFRLLTTAESGKGLEHLRKAVSLYLELMQEGRADDDLRLDLADSQTKLGQALFERGDLTGALERYRATLALCEQPAAANPRDQRYRRALWNTHQRIASVLNSQNNLTGALEAGNKALALAEAMLADDPVNAEHRRAVVMSYKSIAHYRSDTDKQGALEDLRKALALEEDAVAADPANASARRSVGDTHNQIAEMLANAKDNTQALFHFSKAAEAAKKALLDAPQDITLRFAVVLYRAGVAAMQARLGQTDAALQECSQALAFLRDTKEDSANRDHQKRRAQAHEYLGYAYFALAEAPQLPALAQNEHMTAARGMFQESITVLEDLRTRGALDPGTADRAKMIAGEIAKCDTALER